MLNNTSRCFFHVQSDQFVQAPYVCYLDISDLYK